MARFSMCRIKLTGERYEAWWRTERLTDEEWLELEEYISESESQTGSGREKKKGNEKDCGGICCYLSMELIKTENGWRITSYGLEM